jgi:hypothetical protein
MAKGVFVRAVSVLLILVFLSGCASSTKMTISAIEPNGKLVDDATVIVDGEIIGQTPNASRRISNFAGTKTEIIVLKDGYDTVRTEPIKEVKATNVVLGIVLLNFFAWMWVYGPKQQQNIILTPVPAVD